MGQTFNTIASQDSLSNSISDIAENLNTLRSSFSGTSAPSGAVEGQTFYDTDDDLYYVYDGSSWNALSFGASGTYLEAANNLSDVDSASTALSNIGGVASSTYTTHTTTYGNGSHIPTTGITNTHVATGAAIAATKISGTAVTLSGTQTITGEKTFTGDATFSDITINGSASGARLSATQTGELGGAAVFSISSATNLGVALTLSAANNNYMQAGPLTVTSEVEVESDLNIRNDSNTVGHNADLVFQLDDSLGGITDYASITGEIVDNTDTSEDGQLNFNIMVAGTLTESAVLDSVGFTANGTLTSYTNTATPGPTSKLDFDLNDSAANVTTYARVEGEIIDNTNGSEDGQLNFSVMAAGSLTEIATIDAGGMDVTGALVVSDDIDAKGDRITVSEGSDYRVFHGWNASGGYSTWRDSSNVQKVIVRGYTDDVQLDLKDGSVQLTEVTAPAAPSANAVRIYAEDNGSGKTRLMALFASGAAQQIAIQP